MYTAQDNHAPSPKRIPGSRSGGFLFQAHLIPPIAVILISIIMACILSQVPIAAKDPTPRKEDVTQEEIAQTERSEKQIASLFTPEVQYWEPKILSWSKDLNLDPNLVATVMQIESCGNPKATSSVGAMGLFQVMPYHFISGENPYKPNINARRGLAFLKNAFDARGGEPRLALAGYNGGISGTSKPESAWPSETIRYVYWGTGIYADAVKGKTKSPRLNEWLNAGGASLCKQAAKNLGIP